jgi:hypothetical protein
VATTTSTDDDLPVLGVDWDTFAAWFTTTWEQGEHIAIISPTGSGKSTLACHLALMRKWVIALDAKGGDETLEAAGLEQVTQWPLSRKMKERIAEGYPLRIRVGFVPRTLDDFDALKDLLRRVLESIWLDGRWTVIVDELQITADRKMFNLGALIEKLLVGARSKLLSVISLYQAPAWVPTAASRQATYIFIYPTRDIAVIKTIADKIGRPWKELKEVLDNTPRYHFVCASLNPLDPLVMSSPPHPWS